MCMRYAEKKSEFFKWEVLTTDLILEVSAYNEVCNIRSMSGNHLLPDPEL